jgi:HD-GYP domain-containing protein (c-di-GMP phosphodiesterase class II)
MDPGELERRLAEQERLLEVSLELAETLDLRRVLSLALAQAEEICAAETSSIWEVDPAAGELFFRVVRGRAAPEIASLRIPLGEGIVGAVAASGRSERIDDVAADPRWRGDSSSSFATRGMLAAPLVSRGRVIGVLQLLNPVGRERFSADDLRRLRHFAGPLAHALENARLYAAQQRIFLETVTALAEAVEKRDPYTGGHLQRVVAYSLLLGGELGLAVEALENLRLGATLHDIGKIGVPDGVLLKAGPLDDAEQAVMRRHPADGAAIVSRIESLKPLVPIVRNHHERIDGRGYPDRLAGDAIPLEARIVAVADTFDAMTTSRPYRKALAAETAAAEIRRVTGAHLCPSVVAVFDRLYRGGEFTVAAGEKRLVFLSASLDREYNRW